MQDVNVAIVFYSRTGSTEKRALAAAVGALQGRANIRLRRIAETASEETIATVPGWKENHDRMSWEYVAPRGVDMLWAEGLVVAIPDWMSLSSPEVENYLATLAGVKLEGKIAAALGPKGLSDALAAVGLSVMPPVDDAQLAGVGVAEAARAARGTSRA